MKPDKISNQKTPVLKLYTQLMRATNIVTQKMHRHLLTHNLSISQFGVIEALYHLGPLCQKEIGEKILKTSGNITLVIDNLEKRGLVTREKDPADRRKMTVKMTKSGYMLIEKIFPVHSKIAQKVFSVLEPKGQQSLSRILKKLGKANK
ncbi:MAG: MarR family transcriptional regulator [Deltaproteobacteria bacterium]|nr:MAG: MarR family transcriptional regulator [Deltaproteobacteria bacterium]